MISNKRGCPTRYTPSVRSCAVTPTLLFTLASLLVGCQVAGEGQWHEERKSPHSHTHRLQSCDAEVGELARKHCQRHAGMQ